MITENPFTWQSYNLDPNSKGYAATMKLWQKSLTTWAIQMQQNLTSPANLASVLNSAYLLTQSQGLVQVFSTPTTNQTVDTGKNPLVFIQYAWTTAANFTATLNNVVDGQIVCFTLTNASGALRTITLKANTVSSVAMSVITAISTLSSGVSVASGARVEFVGMASATNLFLSGVGQNW